MSETTKTKNSIYNTFIEYYYLFGIDINTIINEIFETSIPFLNQEPPKLKPKLLSKFPPNKSRISNMDENVIKMHCFPREFSVVKSETLPNIEFFHFSLDNLQYSDFVQKIYFTTMIIYEPLSAYKELVNKYDDLLKKEIVTIDSNSEEKIFQKKKSQILQYQRKKTYDFTSLLSKSIFDKKIKQPRKNTFTYNSNNKKSNKQKNKKKTPTKNSKFYYYFPKAVCLSSLAPFPEEKREILNTLYLKVRGKTENITLEKIIENLTLEIPFPTRGCSIYTYKLFNTTIELYQRPLNSINFYSYKMNLIFLFPVIDIIDILKYLLLETPVLFFSSDKEKLTNIFESFLSFLSPFEYQHPHFPILPEINFGLIEILKSFTFGINQKYTVNFFSNYNLNIINKTIQIVDIDVKKIYTYYYYDKELPMVKLEELGNEQMREQSAIEQRENINLPNRYKGKLFDRLKKHFLSLKNQKLETFDKDSIDSLATHFYYFFASIFKDYLNYMYKEEKEVTNIAMNIQMNKDIPINQLFHVEEYLKAQSSNDILFYRKFMETKMFYNFCAKRYLRKTFDDRVNILLFDEEIARKKNKKVFAKEIETPFLKSDKFKLKSKEIIPSIGQFSEKEKSYIIKQSYSIENTPLKYFQDVTENSITYILFPRLLYDNIFFKEKYHNPEIREPSINTSYINSCELIDTEEKFNKIYRGSLVSLYHLPIDKPKTFQFEMESYVYMTWLRFFAMTFHYCEAIEKHFRFYEMLENIKKATFLNKQLLSFVYSSILKYGNEFMSIKMFETIEQLNFIQTYSDYAYLCNKLSGEIVYRSFTKKFSITNSSRMSVVYFKEKDDDFRVFEPTELDISRLKKRSFGLGTEKEQIQYDTGIKCSNCEKPNDLTNITVQFCQMKKEFEMCKCNYCHKENIPIVNVRLGDTDIVESFATCNSYHLYKLTEELVRNYGINLNMDVIRKKYKRIFWNTLWFFMLKGVSFDILLKYKDSTYQEDQMGDDTLLNFSIIPKEQNVEMYEDLSIQKNVVNISYISTKSNK